MSLTPDQLKEIETHFKERYYIVSKATTWKVMGFFGLTSLAGILAAYTAVSYVIQESANAAIEYVKVNVIQEVDTRLKSLEEETKTARDSAVTASAAINQSRKEADATLAALKAGTGDVGITGNLFVSGRIYAKEAEFNKSLLVGPGGTGFYISKPDSDNISMVMGHGGASNTTDRQVRYADPDFLLRIKDGKPVPPIGF